MRAIISSIDSATIQKQEFAIMKVVNNSWIATQYPRVKNGLNKIFNCEGVSHGRQRKQVESCNKRHSPDTNFLPNKRQSPVFLHGLCLKHTLCMACCLYCRFIVDNCHEDCFALMFRMFRKRDTYFWSMNNILQLSGGRIDN